MSMFLIVLLLLLALIALVAIFKTQNKILEELKNIHIPGPQKIEFPNIEIPKIEIPPAKETVLDLNPVVEAINKIEIPKVEIPPAKETVLDLNPVIEAIDRSVLEIKKLREAELAKTESRTESEQGESKLGVNKDLLQNIVDNQSDLVKILNETSVLMRVNEAEFQSGLEAFHKAIDKLLAQIPNGEKELSSQKEFMHKFEDAMRKTQEAATEAMSENSLRLQEILTEVLNKEQKG